MQEKNRMFNRKFLMMQRPWVAQAYSDRLLWCKSAKMPNYQHRTQLDEPPLTNDQYNYSTQLQQKFIWIFFDYHGADDDMRQSKKAQQQQII